MYGILASFVIYTPNGWLHSDEVNVRNVPSSLLHKTSTCLSSYDYLKRTYRHECQTTPIPPPQNEHTLIFLWLLEVKILLKLLSELKVKIKKITMYSTDQTYLTSSNHRKMSVCLFCGGGMGVHYVHLLHRSAISRLVCK